MPGSRTSSALARLALGAMLFCATGASAQTLAPHDAANELEVAATNRSEPVLCAEKDNVDLRLASPLIRSFRIQAVHPAYIGMLQVDRFAPDWTSCDMTGDPSFAAQARVVTFWETPEFWLTGYTFSSFWRNNDVPFRVGDKVEHGFHIVQLWMRHRDRAEEVLVVYPPDGYWRARPLPFADLRATAYGSSFLVGPIEDAGRPIVALREIAYDPPTKTFTLSFARGGAAKMRLTAIDSDHMALDVTFEGAVPTNLPFAAMRSMYATEVNNDVAHVAWRTKGGKGWGEAPVMSFPGGPVTELWAGRHTASRHNTSSPDMLFGRFQKAR